MLFVYDLKINKKENTTRNTKCDHDFCSEMKQNFFIHSSLKVAHALKPQFGHVRVNLCVLLSSKYTNL